MSSRSQKGSEVVAQRSRGRTTFAIKDVKVSRDDLEESRKYSLSQLPAFPPSARRRKAQEKASAR